MKRQLAQILAMIMILVSSAVQPVTAQDFQEAPLLLVSADGTEQPLDREALESMPQMELLTSTPWNSSERRFQGVPLTTLVETGSTPPPSGVRLSAHNGYSVVIPREEWLAHHIIVATRIDNRPISVRDKGPFTIVFGRKDDFFSFLKPNINDEKTPYLVWFLSKVEVLP